MCVCDHLHVVLDIVINGDEKVHDPENDKAAIHEQIRGMKTSLVKTLLSIGLTIRDLIKVVVDIETATRQSVSANELYRITEANLQQQSSAYIEAEQVRDRWSVLAHSAHGICSWSPRRWPL